MMERGAINCCYFLTVRRFLAEGASGAVEEQVLGALENGGWNVGSGEGILLELV